MVLDGMGSMNHLSAADVKATVSSPEFRRFANALRIMIGLHTDDLDRAGVARQHYSLPWEYGPIRWFLGAADQDAALIWRLIEAQQPEEFRAGPRAFNED